MVYGVSWDLWCQGFSQSTSRAQGSPGPDTPRSLSDPKVLRVKAEDKEIMHLMFFTLSPAPQNINLGRQCKLGLNKRKRHFLELPSDCFK